MKLLLAKRHTSHEDEEIVYSSHKYRETEGTKDCKSDLLRVDVVKIINDTFHSIGQPVLTADELLEKIDKMPEVWDLYARGFTMGLNQTEKEKTTERVMRFKPKNTVELAAFIAAIRPGAKSLVDGFVAREPHSYQIPAMDKLLRLDGATGVTGQSAFLFYDEQVMTLAKSAGIPPADANALIKAIKKKKLDKVAAYKDRFIPGFVHYLEEEQNVSGELAEKTAGDVWTVILNSASYLFNASHAYAMCLDSLYGAYLKCVAPYEFYTVLLKLYTQKGNKEKIAAIISEMRRYRDIRLTPGRFGQDNRDWLIDKENHTISQALSSIKFISRQAADDLYRVGQQKFDTFTDLLRTLQMDTCLNKRQILILILLNYFQQFGNSRKLGKIFDEFSDGKDKLTKSLSEKTVAKRLDNLRKFEMIETDDSLPIGDRLNAENEYIGLCISTDASVDPNLYFVQEVDDQYGIKVKLYSVARGTIGTLKVLKDTFAQTPLQAGQTIRITEWKQRPKFTGKKTSTQKIYENWLYSWTEQQGGNHIEA